MKLKIGFFGAAINIVVVTGMVCFSALTRGGASFSDYFSVFPVLAFAAFIVYYFVVSSYVVKRAGIQKPAFIDSLVGMLAELILVTVGVVIYSLWITLSGMHGQDLRMIASELTTGILVNLLWVFAMFLVHILIAGNIAGLVGWYVLSKLSPKSLS